MNKDMAYSKGSGASVCKCRGIECDKEARRRKAGELSRLQKMRLSWTVLKSWDFVPEHPVWEASEGSYWYFVRFEIQDTHYAY